MFCTNCGGKLPDDAKFCPNCGTATDGGSSGQGAHDAETAPPEAPKDTPTIIRLTPASIQVKNWAGLSEPIPGCLIVSDSELWFSPSFKALYGLMHIVRLGTSPWNKAKTWRRELKDVMDVQVCPNLINCSVKILTRDKVETEFVVGRKGRYLAVAESFRDALMARVGAMR